MNQVGSEPTETVEVLLFAIGERMYGVDASTVARIGRPDDEAFERPELGQLRDGRRCLVFWEGEGERQLKIDDVHGVRRVPISELRRLPPWVRASQVMLGAWLDQNRIVFLLNLLKTSTN